MLLEVQAFGEQRMPALRGRKRNIAAVSHYSLINGQLRYAVCSLPLSVPLF